MMCCVPRTSSGMSWSKILWKPYRLPVFHLTQNALRAEGQFLRLYYAEDLAADAKGVVGGTAVRGIFFDRAAVVGIERLCEVEFIFGYDAPAGVREALVDELLPREP